MKDNEKSFEKATSSTFSGPLSAAWTLIELRVNIPRGIVFDGHVGDVLFFGSDWQIIGTCRGTTYQGSVEQGVPFVVRYERASDALTWGIRHWSRRWEGVSQPNGPFDIMVDVQTRKIAVRLKARTNYATDYDLQQNAFIVAQPA